MPNRTRYRGAGARRERQPPVLVALPVHEDHPGALVDVAHLLIRSYSDPQAALLPGHVGKLVSRWMKDAGIKVAGHDGVSAHALRRTCASDVLDGGANVRQVQALLGHSSLTHVARYLRRPDAAALLSVMEGRQYKETP